MATAASRYGVCDFVPDRSEPRLDRLSAGQIDCLALVYQHMNSKEIAARLEISPHTVDQRIRLALQTLGVERRSEAARLAAAAGLFEAPYQRLIHQAPHIDDPAAVPQPSEAVSHQIRHADRAGGTSSAGVITEQATSGRWSSLPLPFATRSKPANELGVGARLLWVLLIALGAMFCAGMYLAGLESLSRLMAK
ncbi:LuxR C-terminal-related transcriptional regulator [Sphingomonas sp. ASV193]|uniref:LuxR C-terminal-related transcriptional regulator n=1 Tax=Sphingomonas sp. ASV193 TaxID=3144405 RepID=UPI0032E89A02